MSDETFDLTELDHPDNEMLERLKACSTRYGAPIPDRVHQGALAAFSWRGVDEELAALLSDSADSDRLVGARSSLAGMRLLEFATPTGQISIGLTATGLMTGTLTGFSGQTTQLVSAAGQCVDLTVDEFGEFLCDEIPIGPVRIELGKGTSRVVTDWMLPPVA
jgi:hypothetical protein